MRYKLPKKTPVTSYQQSIPRITGKEDPFTYDIRNTSRRTNTKIILKVFVLVNSMLKDVQRWDITKRIDNKRKA